MIFKRYKELKRKNEKYEHDILELKSLLNNKIEECKLLNEDKFNLKLEKQNWTEMKNIMSKRVDELDKANYFLSRQNKDLLEWVNKIIDVAHVYQVDDREPVNIPIYRETKRIVGAGKILVDNPDYGTPPKFIENGFDTETITIPEIRIIRNRR